MAILLVSASIKLTSQHFCGTEIDLATREREEMRLATCSTANLAYCQGEDETFQEVCGAIRIPLKFFVHYEAGDITPFVQEIQETVEQENTKFADAGLEFYIIPEEGIEAIEGSSFADPNDYPNIIQYLNFAVTSTGFIDGVINIHVSESSFISENGSIVGQVVNIGGTTNQEQLMYLSGPSFNQNDYTYAHELGHIFGLYHTFTTYFGAGGNCENYNDCNSGDGIGDTAFDDQSYDNGANDCEIMCVNSSCCPPAEDQYLVMYNVMSYYEACSNAYNVFSALQNKKMNDVARQCKDVIDYPPSPPIPNQYIYNIITGENVPVLSVDNALNLSRINRTTSLSCVNWYADADCTELLSAWSMSFQPVIDNLSPGTHTFYIKDIAPFNAQRQSTAVPITINVTSGCDNDGTCEADLGETANNCTDCQGETHVISGTITNSNNQPVNDVEVNLSYAANQNDLTTNTDTEGYYYFDLVPSGSSGTITPQLDGYTFNPTNSSFSSLTSDQVFNFVMTAEVPPPSGDYKRLFWPFETSRFVDPVCNSTGLTCGDCGGASHCSAQTLPCGTDGWYVARHEGVGCHFAGDYYSQDWNTGAGVNDDCGELIFAPMSGTVIHAGPGQTSEFGEQVVIQSSFNPTQAFRVAHLESVAISEGPVVAGQLLGALGTTGNSSTCHAHMSMYKDLTSAQINTLGNGGWVNSVDNAYRFQFDLEDQLSLASPGATAGECYASNGTIPITINEDGTMQRVVIEAINISTQVTTEITRLDVGNTNGVRVYNWEVDVPFGLYRIKIYDEEALLAPGCTNNCEVPKTQDISQIFTIDPFCGNNNPGANLAHLPNSTTPDDLLGGDNNFSRSLTTFDLIIGNSYTSTFEIINNGTFDGEVENVALILSEDDELSTDDLVLYNATFNTWLTPQETLPGSAIYDVPDVLPGPYYAIFVVVAAEGTVESNLEDNVLPIPVNLIEGIPDCLPVDDHEVVNIADDEATVNWSSLTIADSYEFRYRVQGSSNWTTEIVFFPEIILDNLNECTAYEYRITTWCIDGSTSVAAWGSFQTSGNCDSGEACSVPTGLVVDGITLEDAQFHWNAVPGAIEYQVNVVGTGTNYSNTTEDTDFYFNGGLNSCTNYTVSVAAICQSETSPATTSQFSTIGCPNAQPDLEINMLGTPAAAYAVGDVLDISYEVCNTGSGPTYFISYSEVNIDDNIVTNDGYIQHVWEEVTPTNLGAGQCVEVNYSQTIDPIPNGDYYLFFTADYYNHIEEASEGNNNVFFPITIDETGGPTGIAELTYPNGGETILNDGAEPISWIPMGCSSVTLEYSLDNGSSWTVISESILDNGGYLWFMPADAISTQARIRVTCNDDPSVTDESDGSFSIVPLGGFPANDSACSAENWGVSNDCIFDDVSTIAASDEGISAACGGGAIRDVWYRVVVPANGVVNVRTRQIGLSSLNFEVFSGSCSSLQFVDCITHGGGDVMPALSLSGLSPGQTLYIRFWFDDGQQSVFDLCVNSCGLELSGGTSTDASCGQSDGSITGVQANINDLTYTWRDVDGNVVGNSIDLIDVPAGLYELTASAGTACSAIAYFQIGADQPLPTPLFGFSTNDLTISLTNSSVNATSYSWNFGDGNNSSATSPTHTYSAAGSYTVTLTASNSCGSASSQVLVNVGQGISGNSTIFSKEYTYTGFNFSIGARVVTASDGNYIALGIASNYQRYLVKIDPNGNVLWGTSLGVSFPDYFVDMKASEDGGVYLLLEKDSDNYNILKINSNGSKAWHKNLSWDLAPANFFHLESLQLIDDGILIGAYDRSDSDNMPMLIKMNFNGSLDWFKVFDNFNPDQWPASNSNGTTGIIAMTETSDGHILSLVEMNRQGTGDCLGLLKTTQTGDLVWAEMYYGDSSIDPQDVLEINGDYIILGSSHLLVTDSDGNLQESVRLSSGGYHSGYDIDGSLLILGGEKTMIDLNNAEVQATIDLPFPYNGAGDLTSEGWVVTTNNYISTVTFDDQAACDLPSGNVVSIPYSVNTYDITTSELTGGCGASPCMVGVSNTNSIPVSALLITSEDNCPPVLPCDLEVTDVVVNDASCNQANGSATANPAGGVPPYAYEWNTNPTQNTATAVGLAAGTYTVTVTDAQGCTAEIDVSIDDVFVSINVQMNTENISCAGDNDGAINLTVFGGTEPYSYEWSNGQVGPNVQNLSAGTYTVTVTDANNCSTTETGSITSPSSLSISVTDVMGSSCSASNGSAMAIASGGTGNLTINWSNGAVGSSVSNLISGSYTVTAIDDNGCIAASSFNVPDISSDITITGNAQAADCGQANGSIAINVSGAVAPYTIDWSNGETGTEVLTGLNGGNYSVFIVDANGCEAGATFLVDQPAPLQLSLSLQAESSCGSYDGSASLSVSGGSGNYDIQWYTEPPGIGYTATGLTAGEYWVEVIDASGCTEVYNFAIGNAPGGVADAQFIYAINDNTVSFEDYSISADDYYWDFGDGQEAFIANPIIEFSAGEQYEVCLTISNYCGYTDTECQFVTIPALDPCEGFEVYGTAIAARCGENNGQITLTIIDEQDQGYDIDWLDGNLPAWETVTDLSPGSYQVLVTSFAGCSRLLTLEVEESSPSTLQAPLVNPANCETGGSIQLQVEGNAPFAYQWSHDQTLSGAEASNLAPGTYAIAITDILGCEIFTTVEVPDASNNILLEITNLVGAGCEDNTGGQVSIAASGGAGNYDFSIQELPNGELLNSNEAENLSVGVYQAIAVDQNGCSGAILFEISGSSPPEIIEDAMIVETSPCYLNQNSVTNIEIIGGQGQLSFLWEDEAGVVWSQTEDLVGIPSGAYQLTVEDAAGCVAFSSVITIAIPEPLTVNLADVMLLDDVCGQGEGAVEGVVVSGDGDIFPVWTNVFGDTLATTLDLLNVPSGGYHLEVTNSHGCRVDVGSFTIGNSTDLVFDYASLVVEADTCELALGQISGVSVTSENLLNTQWLNHLFQPIANAENLLAGTYFLEATSTNGCIQLSVPIFVPQAPAPMINTENATILAATCGEANGSIVGVEVLNVDLITDEIRWLDEDGEVIRETSDLVNVSAGNYTIIIENSAGCQAQAEFTVPGPLPIVLDLMQTQEVSMPGGNDGLATAQVEGGSGNFTYVWSNGASTSTVSNLEEGQVCVTVTDETDACTVVACLEIIAYGMTSATEDVSCHGGNDGLLAVNIVGGQGPYQYQWEATDGTLSGEGTIENPQGVVELQGDLVVGLYYVTLTDAEGIEAVTEIHIDEPSDLELSLDVLSDVSCFDACDGGINVSAVGGTGTYQYQWSNGDLGPFTQGLCPGNYGVTLTDENGCVEEMEYMIESPSSITLTAEQTVLISTIGGTDGEASVVASGGSGVYTYLWDNAATTATITDLAEGEYCVTVVDENGCAEDACIQVLAFGPVSTSVNPSCADLNDGMLVISAYGGNPPYSYTWEDEAGNVSTGSIENSNVEVTIATGLFAGSYQIILEDSDGFSATRMVELEAPLPLVMEVEDIIDPSCFDSCDGLISVTASGGTGTLFTEWSDGQTGYNRTGLCATIYELTLSDENNCQLNNAFELIAPPPIELTEEIGFTDCNDENSGFINANAVGGTGSLSYNWSNGTNAASITNLSAGSYSLVISDENNCGSTFEFDLDTPPTISLQEMIQHLSCTDAQDGMISIEPEGTVGTYTYNWSNGETTSEIVDLSAGPYSVTVIDEMGCLETFSYEINSPEALTVVADITNSDCFSEPNGGIALSVSGGVGSYDYQWNDPALQGANVSVYAGVYEVVVTDANDCLVEVSLTITEPEPITVTVSDSQSPSCYGVADGSIAVSTQGGLGNYAYLWNTGSEDAFLTNIEGGEYYLTVTDGAGCFVEEQIELNQPEAIDPNINIVYGCGDGNIVVQANPNSGVAPYLFNWSTGETDHLIYQITAGNYSLEVEDSNGCVSIEEFQVEYVEPFEIDVWVENVTCPADEDGFIDLMPSGGIPPYLYNWSNGATTQDLENLSPGIYQVNVTSVGCGRTISVEVPGLQPLDVELILTENNQGTLDGLAFVTGGTGPYEILWDNGSVGNSLDQIEPETEVTISVVDSNGCTYEETFFAMLTHLSSLPEEMKILASPNPTSGLLWLDIESAPTDLYEVVVLNVNGQVVYETSFMSLDHTEIDLSTLPAGIYSLNLRSKRFYGRTKVVVVK